MTIRAYGLLSAFLVSAAVTVQGQDTVVVRPGQTLTGISQEIFGTPDRWEDICEANRDTIGNNCDRVRYGVTLKVPTSAPSEPADVLADPASRPPEPADQPTEAAVQGGEPADAPVDPSVAAGPVDQPANPAPPDSSPAVVAGPIDLSTSGWVAYGATLVDGTPPSVESEISLLRAAVYDPEAQTWLAGPVDYEIKASGRQALHFATGPETRAIRIYPLRGRDNARWVYLRLDGVEPSTDYRFEWSVSERNNVYTVSEITVRVSEE